MEIWGILQRAVELFPGQPAVVDGTTRRSYAQVGERAAGVARFLRQLGVEGGDRLSVLDHNTAAFLELYFAAAGLGAILNPLNHRLAPAEVAAVLEDAGTRWLVASPRLAGLVERVADRAPGLEGVLWTGSDGRDLQLPCHDLARAAETHGGWPLERVPAGPDEVAHLYYTSGTTGRPKGVMLTQRNVCVHALAAVAELQLTEREVWGHIAPMFHLADAWATFAVTWVGGRHVMVPTFSVEATLDAIEGEGITLSNVIPTMLNLLVKHPEIGTRDLSSLRLVLSGGAPIAPELVRRVMQVFGCGYIQTYGMTETSPYLTLSTLTEEQRRLPTEEQLAVRARTGRPFLTVELEVVDARGAPVAKDDREVGEIWVRGETVTPGYWQQPEATEEAFARGGWLRTGDLATVNHQGSVNIVDRKKDMIICGGENVYSIEVENVLYEHPAVLEAAVHGRPDETWGEMVCAAVVLRQGRQATDLELIDFCRERLAAYKAPRSVRFLSSLPRTGSGKIQKRALRDAGTGEERKKQEG